MNNESQDIFKRKGFKDRLQNSTWTLKLRGFNDEIKAMYTLFGSESGVKDKNDLYISIEDIIDYL